MLNWAQSADKHKCASMPIPPRSHKWKLKAICLMSTNDGIVVDTGIVKQKLLRMSESARKNMTLKVCIAKKLEIIDHWLEQRYAC